MRKRLFNRALPIACLILASVSAHAQRRVSSGTNQSVRQLVLRIENRANLFRNSVQAWSNRNYSQANNGNEDINLLVRDFNDNVRLLRERFDQRQVTSADVQGLLNRAARVDDFVRRQALDMRSRNHWSSLRVDLNQLSRHYNVSWPQTGGNYPPYGTPVVNQFRGTYRLDVSRSDDAQRAADEATRDLAPSERRRIRDLVVQRLQSPEQIAIDVRGRTVTLASTRAPQISFEADGRERVETAQTGRTIRSRATLTANQLTVSSSGDTGNEFTVTFDPIDNGRRMNVLRRVYVPALSRPVVVQSMYEKFSDVAQFNIYDSQNPTYPGSTGGFVVPDGARVAAVLDDSLSTRTAVVGDRFTLRVNEPREFSGATIEGHVSHVQRSGRLTGRSVLTLDFDSIRLRDGRSYRFAGLVEGVRTANGEIVRVDSEGTVREDSQTNRTGERAAIGTAVGAIIGAIAGGGKGAAIGAIIGASSGAGSVYVQGRNDLELGRGSEIVIRSGAPVNTPR
jgi:YmgG-like glycine-zipper protein